MCIKCEPVNVQPSCELERQQQQARGNLMKIVGGVKYSPQQGLAFQSVESGNFSHLLKYKQRADHLAERFPQSPNVKQS